MTEVQKHGFTFEDWIKKIIQEHPEKSKYTQKWDIPGELPISIKCIGEKNALELSSAIRLWETTSPFLLIVGRWKQMKEFKKIISIDELFIDLELLKKLKGTLTLEELKGFNSKITSFPAGKEGQRAGIAYAKKWKRENARKIGVITITHKIDSKNQRRLQCNINYKNYLKIFGEPSWKPLFRGHLFDGEIASASRIFNKKNL
jgi:hypothetical protein